MPACRSSGGSARPPMPDPNRSALIGCSDAGSPRVGGISGGGAQSREAGIGCRNQESPGNAGIPPAGRTTRVLWGRSDSRVVGSDRQVPAACGSRTAEGGMGIGVGWKSGISWAPAAYVGRCRDPTSPGRMIGTVIRVDRPRRMSCRLWGSTQRPNPGAQPPACQAQGALCRWSGGSRPPEPDQWVPACMQLGLRLPPGAGRPVDQCARAGRCARPACRPKCASPPHYCRRRPGAVRRAMLCFGAPGPETRAVGLSRHTGVLVAGVGPTPPAAPCLCCCTLHAKDRATDPTHACLQQAAAEPRMGRGMPPGS